MSWFAAHLVMYVRFTEGRQSRFPVWENIVLIKAESEEEAFAKAEKRGRQDEGDDDGSFRWGNHPALWVFAGVRKLTGCQDENRRPGDGTEISFLEMEFPSEVAVRKFVSGESAAVKMVDQIATEEPELLVQKNGK